MSFTTRETSAQDGRPIHLVKFYRTGKMWFNTNADQDIVFNGNTYKAIPFSFTAISQTGDAQSENLQFTLPAAADLCVYLDSLSPTETVNVILRRVHIDENSDAGTYSVTSTVADAPVVWVGEVINLSRPSINSRVLTCNTLALTLARGGLRLSWGRNCPHVLYGRGCTLDKSLFVTALTGVSVVNGITLAADQFGGGVGTDSATIDITDDMSSLAGWTINPGQADVYNYTSKITLDSAAGNPLPCFVLGAENNTGNPAYAVRDFGIADIEDTSMEMDVMITDVGGNDSGFASMLFGATATGGGTRIIFGGKIGENLQIGLYKADTFLSGEGVNVGLEVITGAMTLNKWYTVRATKVVNPSDGYVQTIAHVFDGATDLGNVTAVYLTQNGGFCGPYRSKGDDRINIKYDNIHVEASSSTAVTGFSGGFLEWDSEPGVLERTGIESEGDGVITVLGSTQGMAGGSNFRAYLGCDRTAPTCNRKFRNILNYGGINHMQGRSPFDGAPVY